MKKYFMVLVAILSLYVCLGFPQTVYGGISAEGVADIVDRDVSRLIQEEAVKGGIVSIVKDGHVILIMSQLGLPLISLRNL